MLSSVRRRGGSNCVISTSLATAPPGNVRVMRNRAPIRGGPSVVTSSTAAYQRRMFDGSATNENTASRGCSIVMVRAKSPISPHRPAGRARGGVEEPRGGGIVGGEDRHARVRGAKGEH